MEMSARDEGPVYYREIQKNAYLKRIPNDVGGSKLRPLGHNKKPPLKPMWTLFCVHNGRTPFLEQYPEAESPATLSHKPAWRACLRAARHVTASVKPHVGDEYDFLVDTDHGPVRMLAPDWESMQDWVTTLRSKLHELKILSKGENVYCAPPAAPPPRAAARDPTSPLPPTPPVPPDRVPGIELLTPIVQPTVPEPPTEPEPVTEPEAQTDNAETVTEAIDISSWDTAYSPLPSTSQEPKIEPSKSVAKICGQNICLDDSILKRTAASTESDEEFFSEIDRIHDEVSGDEGYGRQEYTQRLLVNDEEKPGSSHCGGDGSDRQATNITVIQVSNKPPHTAIPVMGSDTDVFDFNFKQHLSLTPQNQTENPNSFVNIVNTEVNVQNPIENGYGTVFDKDSDYGHLSLTTTVNLTGDVKTDATEGLYERLCLASTSVASPLPVRKIKNLDKIRKSSLPNLDTASESAYEYLFPNFSHNRNNNSNITNTTLNSTGNDLEEREEINSNINTRNERHNSNDSRNNISDNSRSNITNSDTSRSNITNISDNSRSNITNISDNSRSIITNSDNSRSNITNISDNSRSNITNVSDNSRSNITNPSGISRSNISNDRVHMNVTNSVSVGNDSNSRTIRSNVERSHSQNAYDTSPRQRENLIRRVQNNSPKTDGKNDKSDAPKPIWRRGLTELSLLSRLRGIGQGKRHESPTRHDEQSDRSITSPANVVHRSRPEARVDGTRRRSSSLSNGQSPPASLAPCPALQPLRARQAAALRAEQRRGAALATTVSTRDTKVFCDYNGHVWVAWWSLGGARCCGRAGDRVAALRGTTPKNAQHARQLLKSSPTHTVDILLHRVPLGKIYVLNKRDLESIGIKLDSECNIVHVSVQSAAARAGLPPAGRWAVTEVNNRPINLIKGGEEEMNRLSAHGSEVSILIQPSALVKKIRAAVKQDSAFYQIRSILHSFH